MISPGGTILEACRDPVLFQSWFRDEATWLPWFTLLAAVFGLPMTAEMMAVFETCTGRTAVPSAVSEVWLICGRRAGKSFVLALVAVFLACFVDWAHKLAPGEAGVVLVTAADRKQARVIFRYARSLLRVPVLSSLVEGETAETISLANSIEIEISTSNYRTVRGYTLIAMLGDEIAFWRSDESANPDTEILAAARPGLATTGGLLLCASSPYARRGALYQAFRQYYSKGGPVLVWKADTRTMNPTVPQSVIDEAYVRDPASAAAEYGAEFRSDVETFVSREVVDALVITRRYELPPVSGRGYFAFADPSGGSQDSMTLAIAHRSEDGRAVLDAVRERRPPFSPDEVCGEFSAILKSYGLSEVYGDRYAGEWPRERFSVHGIEYRNAGKPKSDIYRELLPQLNSGQVELLDDPRLVAQFCGLERRTTRGGRDSIDHGPGSHDDIANAVAGALWFAGHRAGEIPIVSPVIVTSRDLAWEAYATGRVLETLSSFEMPRNF